MTNCHSDFDFEPRLTSTMDTFINAETRPVKRRRVEMDTPEGFLETPNLPPKAVHKPVVPSFSSAFGNEVLNVSQRKEAPPNNTLGKKLKNYRLQKVFDAATLKENIGGGVDAADTSNRKPRKVVSVKDVRNEFSREALAKSVSSPPTSSGASCTSIATYSQRVDIKSSPETNCGSRTSSKTAVESSSAYPAPQEYPLAIYLAPASLLEQICVRYRPQGLVDSSTCRLRMAQTNLRRFCCGTSTRNCMQTLWVQIAARKTAWS